MGNNSSSSQQAMQDKPDISPRWVLGFRLGLIIGMGGALTARDIAEELGLSERQAYRFFDSVVEDNKALVTGEGGYLRLQKSDC
jgi:AraC-like DNA-binding protein